MSPLIKLKDTWIVGVSLVSIYLVAHGLSANLEIAVIVGGLMMLGTSVLIRNNYGTGRGFIHVALLAILTVLALLAVGLN